MVTRRTFLSMMAGAAAAPGVSWGQSGAGQLALYAAVGPELTQYDVNVDGASLTKRGTVTLPANVQYVWPHQSRRYLYVATSSSASGTGPKGTVHHVSAFRIAPDGTLTPRGTPDAIIADEAMATAQVTRMVLAGRVRATSGADVSVQADTVSLHGDGPHAVSLARRLRDALNAAGIELRGLA